MGGTDVAAHRSIGVLAIVFAALASGCASGSAERTPPDALSDDAITVASFNFPESELLAQIYGQALVGAGYDVRIETGVGPREFVQPALSRGLVEFLPEYAGTATQFLSLGAATPQHETVEAHNALAGALRGEPVAALAPSSAENANAVVVTRATAERYRLRLVSDLAAVASRLTFGGPPECPSRPFCLRGLHDTYHLDFANFVALDVGGPLTRTALKSGGIDVALLFTTDPELGGGDLIALDDDRGLQPAENVTPLVRREVIERWGRQFVMTVDAVSSRLTTDVLRDLNRRVAAGTRAERVAATWLAQEGLG